MAQPAKIIGTLPSTPSAIRLPSGEIVLQLKDSAGNLVPIKITPSPSTLTDKHKQLHVFRNKAPNILKKTTKSNPQYIVRKNDALAQTVVMPSPCSGPAVVSLGGQVTQIQHRPIILFCPTPAATTDLPGLPSSGVTTLEAGNSQLLSPLGAPSLDTNVTDNQPVDISLDLPEFMKPRNDVDEVIGSPVTSLNTSLDLIDVKSGAVGSSEAHSSPSVEVPKDVYCPTPSLINIMQLEDDTMPLEDEDIPLDDGSISLNDETLPLEPEEKIMADGMFCVDGDLASNPESLSSDCLTVSTSLSTPSVTSSDHTSTIEHSVTDFETSSQHAQPESPSPFSDLENTSVLPSLSEKLENQEGIAINPPQEECYVYVDSHSGKLVYVNSKGEAFMAVPGASNSEGTSDLLGTNIQSHLTDLPMSDSLGFPDEVGAETVVVTTVMDQNLLNDQDQPVLPKPSNVEVLPTEPCLSGLPLGGESEGLNWSDVWLSDPQENTNTSITSDPLCPLPDAALTAMATDSLTDPARLLQSDQKRKELTIREINKRERDRLTKREMRKNDEFRLKERNQAKERMKNKRADPTYRQIERVRDKLRRRQARLRNKTQRMQERDRDRMNKRRMRPGSVLVQELDSAHYYSLGHDGV